MYAQDENFGNEASEMMLSIFQMMKGNKERDLLLQVLKI